MKNNIPETIQGIPTAKGKSKERVFIIKSLYSELWKNLQKQGKRNIIYNNYLGVDVYIVDKESDKKTAFAASKNWQSTYAIKYLEKVVSKAKAIPDTPIYQKPKTGTQTKSGYKNIAVLYYDFTNSSYDYLNFTVKLTIGIKADNKHVQYCINKIEMK